MTNKKVSKISSLAKNLTVALAIFVVVASIPLFFFVYFLNRSYPNIYVSGINVSNKNQTEILFLLKTNTTIPQSITLTYNNQTFSVPTADLNINYDYEKSAKRALLMGRSGNPTFDVGEIIKSILYQKNYGLYTNLDEGILLKDIDSIEPKIATLSVEPTYSVNGSTLTIASKGTPGTQIDKNKLTADIENSLGLQRTNSIEISLSQKSDSDIADSIIAKIAPLFIIAPLDAKLSIENGKVKTFIPEKEGLALNVDKLKKDIENALERPGNNIAINIQTNIVTPKIKASDINNLGIKELIGSGTSHFAGSIASRIFNINLAASRIDNTLIAPGAVFSFDNSVGDISSLNGYQQAYIISNGQTILGDGGGVCQVSTTMFRAAMNTGLPIVERHAHAYRVHYYEEDADPGFDATIYTPTVDFKFKNDTANYILIQTQIDLKTLDLTFNLYGTKDGRTVNITKPVLSDYKPAPANSYTDDPTLPVGTVKQIDFAASGIKSVFNYTVSKNGEVINKQTFTSVFAPWQAKFLRGTKV